jgi:hypothetical protein
VSRRTQSVFLKSSFSALRAHCSQNLKNARNPGRASGSLHSMSFGSFQLVTVGLDRKEKNVYSSPSRPIYMWMFHFDLQDQLHESLRITSCICKMHKRHRFWMSSMRSNGLL